MSKIFRSLMILLAIGSIAGVATYSYFSDTETSTGNTFTAGSLDLKIDHKKMVYNGNECQESCTESTNNLVTNGSFESPTVTHGDHWQVFNSISPWTVAGIPDSGDTIGLEYHENGIYLGSTAADGTQYVELDGYYPAKISQDIASTSSGKYKISFKYAPRPGHSENKMKVMFGDTEILNASLSSSIPFTWTSFSQEVSGPITGTITISFEETGANDQLGMFLDDVKVNPMDCTYQLDGETCKLWEEKDLATGDIFWNFSDVKPGDQGANVISIDPYDNNAWVCMRTANEEDLENTRIDPETEAGDLTPGTGITDGELSKFLKVFTWWDDDADGFYDSNEDNIITTDFGVLGTIALADSTFGSALIGGQTKNLGVYWCAGTLTSPVAGSPFSCSIDGMDNTAQTDIYTTDIEFYAEQERNNPNFKCSDWH